MKPRVALVLQWGHMNPRVTCGHKNKQSITNITSGNVRENNYFTFTLLFVLTLLVCLIDFFTLWSQTPHRAFHIHPAYTLCWNPSPLKYLLYYYPCTRISKCLCVSAQGSLEVWWYWLVVLQTGSLTCRETTANVHECVQNIMVYTWCSAHCVWGKILDVYPWHSSGWLFGECWDRNASNP